MQKPPDNYSGKQRCGKSYKQPGGSKRKVLPDFRETVQAGGKHNSNEEEKASCESDEQTGINRPSTRQYRRQNQSKAREDETKQRQGPRNRQLAKDAQEIPLASEVGGEDDKRIHRSGYKKDSHGKMNAPAHSKLRL
ncbi:MAG TPA: hypothetical protein PLM14_10355 [Candidatus Hydrogenedentes bacterium]|nr:hypothetical protein [Candidatus Hydrogenedentota bacterium]HQE83391.1 hypothetical protein [Candidatus Hydrogenedentota bacterium]HQH51473.1 hypothetical protein [Candidatus Hydrogenedentota bacterium]